MKSWNSVLICVFWMVKSIPATYFYFTLRSKWVLRRKIMLFYASKKQFLIDLRPVNKFLYTKRYIKLGSKPQ